MFNFFYVPEGFLNFEKAVHELFDNLYSNPHLQCTILDTDMMSIFPNCVKNVRIQALIDSVEFS